MKKLMFLAICAMAVMISCKNAGQTAPADSNDSMAVAAVIDSIIEENDTTPLPMFLIGDDGKYLQMLYWTNVEEPQKTDDNAEYFESWHKNWEFQEMFRRNAAQYTNLLDGDKIIKIKFIDEVLKDPDGNKPSMGEIHRKEIPSLCARFDYADAKDRPKADADGFIVDTWGRVIVTDSYLNSRKRLDVKYLDEEGGYPSLPADIVKQLEKEYGMKAANSRKIEQIGGRYVHGTIEFEGEYKNAQRGDNYDKERRFALALEILVDSDKVYKYEALGYYSEDFGCTWNADADGYIPNDIVAAFEGPKGLELCFTHGAPESFCVGMVYLREGKLVEHQYEMFHALVDEEIPVWKKDLEEMKKLYLADDPHAHKYVELTKWAHCYIDYNNEWIWLRDSVDKNGAFFIRKDGKLRLVDVENQYQSPSSCQKDGVSYLKFSGSPGGPAMQHIIYAFQDGKQLWKLFALEVYGELDDCALNGKQISKEQGKAYLDKVPEGEEINVWFKNINGDGEN
ncbi:MAG: hypothetical protein IK075_12745 [Prevotella sp.]|nr:hypothetical protein [Prevotella sp.]